MSGDITLMDFYADWCGPCDAQEPIIEEIKQEMDINVEKIDVDEKPEKANEYGVRGIPHLIIEQDGEVISTFEGTTAKEEIVAEIPN